MSGRRLLAAAGAAVFGLLLVATPASAAEPTVDWTNPTDEDPVITTTNGLVLKGTITGDAGDKIRNVSFALLPVGPAEPDGDPCRAVIDGEPTFTPERPTPETPQTVPVDFEAPLKVPCNRTYEISATITYCAVALTCEVDVATEETTASLEFEVAIPPAQVTGLNAAYDPATKEVRLTWNPNPEVDLLGYRVLRNPPGRDGFEPLPELFTAPEFLDIGIDAPHRYQVVAVREGPDGPIEGKVSAAVTAGPEPPAPTLSSTPAPRRAAGSRPAVRKRTPTTVDTGFSRDLPFDPNQTTTSQLPATTEPDGQAAVLAEFDDDEGDDDRRATLVPIAGGLALLMSAVHLRLLSNRVGEDDIPILPGS